MLSLRTLRSLLVAAIATTAAAGALADSALQNRAKAIFGPLPTEAANPANPTSPAKVDLGRMLYYDATVKHRFQEAHAETVTAGFQELGLPAPDFSQLSRAEALTEVHATRRRSRTPRALRRPPAICWPC